jgi:hypothetical protein
MTREEAQTKIQALYIRERENEITSGQLLEQASELLRYETDLLCDYESYDEGWELDYLSFGELCDVVGIAYDVAEETTIVDESAPTFERTYEEYQTGTDDPDMLNCNVCGAYVHADDASLGADGMIRCAHCTERVA